MHDFAINECELRENELHSLLVISRKKEGSIFYLNPTDKRFV